MYTHTSALRYKVARGSRASAEAQGQLMGFCCSWRQHSCRKDFGRMQQLGSMRSAPTCRPIQRKRDRSRVQPGIIVFISTRILSILRFRTLLVLIFIARCYFYSRTPGFDKKKNVDTVITYCICERKKTHVPRHFPITCLSLYDRCKITYSLDYNCE